MDISDIIFPDEMNRYTINFSTVKINNEVVKPVKLKKVNKKNIIGYNYFPALYPNIFLCARKKTGKSSVIMTIVENCINKDTKIFVFCSTCKKDPTYLHMEKYLQDNKNQYIFFTSIKENGVNILEQIVSSLKSEEPEVNETSQQEPLYIDKVCNFGDDDDSELIVKITKKVVKIAPKYLFIFDDISTELGDPSISLLLKTNRHILSKVIISSQYPNDIKPESRKQVDFWLLFKGHSDEKLEEIYKIADINIPLDVFIHLYHDATAEDYNFLYIDTDSMTFRKNFNCEYKIDNIH